MPIYDRSYRRWDGELKKRALRFLPIAGSGIQMAVRTKRTILWTIVFYLFLMASSAPFLILLLFNYLFYFPPAALQATELSTFLNQIAPYRVLEYLSYHRLIDLAG